MIEVGARWLWVAMGLTLTLLFWGSGVAWAAGNTTPQAELARWQLAAGQKADAARGEAFFKATHGGEWSCASCHGPSPTQEGQHVSTGKRISPLAPSAHSQRLTDSAKVDKWLRRNCKDVLSRECSPLEKADVLAYLVSLK
jgi:cytochrome c553